MKTFLVIKAGMGLGGIETYIYRMAKWILDHKGRVVFIAIKGTTYADTFSDVILNRSEVYNIDIHDPMWIKRLELHFLADEEVIAYTFSLYSYAMMESIRSKYKETHIQSFFWIPHYDGKNTFPELELPLPVRGAYKRYLGGIYNKMDKNNNIVYVNASHREAVTKNYNFDSAAYPGQIIRITGSVKPLDVENLNERAKRNTFTIITVSRFVFPQKGYLIGLIEAFGQLAPKYEQLRLIIIGDGDEAGRKQINDAVMKIDDSVRNKISLVGTVEYSLLPQYFQKAQLNIGVATTIYDGAINGVISIPARHDTYSCEGYGFLPESVNECVSIHEGKPIIPYIEEVINFSDKEYIERSIAAYNTYALDNEDEYWENVVSNTNIDEKKLLPWSFRGFVQFRYLVSGWVVKLRAKLS